MTRLAAPKRIQRKRTRGWRMPEGAVYVGRPSRWGNPYTLEMMAERVAEVRAAFPNDEGLVDLNPATMAVDAFRADLTRGPDSEWWWFGPHARMIQINLAIDEIRGRDLACWCPLDQPCHADVLLNLANRGVS